MMQNRRRRSLLHRIADLTPPSVRDRLVPLLENHVLPVLSHVTGPAIKLTIAYVVFQVVLSQSTSVQAAWNAVKRITPRPVHGAVAAVGETSIGGAAWSATLAIRSGADRVFNPVRDVHEQQRQKGEEAAEGVMHLQKAVDEVLGQPVPPSVDEQMKRIEEGTPPTPRSR